MELTVRLSDPRYHSLTDLGTPASCLFALRASGYEGYLWNRAEDTAKSGKCKVTSITDVVSLRNRDVGFPSIVCSSIPAASDSLKKMFLIIIKRSLQFNIKKKKLYKTEK